MALCVALLVVPQVVAHADHERPRLQDEQEFRSVHPALAGTNATVELLRASDPTTDYVRHVLDLKRGVVAVEHRPQASDAGGAFFARWTLTRVVEYRDQNRDGAYSPGVDIAVRSWKPAGYSWNASGPATVRVADVQGQLLRWQGNSSGAPGIRLDAVAAGESFVDEGATVRAQDVILYLDFLDFPPRGTGNLHAVEGLVQASPGATIRVDEGDGVRAGLVVEAPRRLAFLDWGAEGEVDGQEKSLAVTLDEPAADGSREFRIHAPLMERSLRMVLVSGVEYEKEDRRADGAGVALVLASVVGVALAVRTRRR